MLPKIMLSILLTACLTITITGCDSNEQAGQAGNTPSVQESGISAGAEQPPPEQPAETGEIAGEAPSLPQQDVPEPSTPATAGEQPAAVKPSRHVREVYVPLLENHPLHRSGELSPDDRYYAYEERSSLILVRMPTAEEYKADGLCLPQVLFTDGRRNMQAFKDIEEDYARRLREPRLTLDELTVARNSLRSVYDWNVYFSPKFSADSRYLAYLHENGFGQSRMSTLFVVDLADNVRVYTLALEESGEYAEVAWREDNMTLEIYLPYAEPIEQGYLALRRQWHLPSGEVQAVYYNADTGQQVSLDGAEQAITAYKQIEAEAKREEEEMLGLTVEERVAGLTPEELADAYAQYFTLYPEQIMELEERDYSSEAISGMDSADFEKVSYSWLLSEDSIRDMKNIYADLKNEDLSQWTYQDAEEYGRLMTRAQNAPPEKIRQEILARQLPFDLDWSIAKEFHGWENMLAYTNEAIVALYESWQETSALFQTEEAYRQAIRYAYLERKNGTRQ
ncbi:MAG: hypothetical protein RBT41_00860 [Clostridia bacterium]|jgi:hypothetical protein|nr:hypothetical protein [Clostridia bacterium]